MIQSTLRIEPPNPKQRLLYADRHKYIAYGGARGGGKSWGVRTKLIYMCLKWPGLKALILRRTYPELERNHIQPLRDLLGDQYGRYNEQKKQYTFHNGSTISFGYCATEGDLERYQGAEYDVIVIDEATQMEEIVFQKLKACLRGTNPFPKRMYLTCNPGGRGHAWVRRLFIDRLFREGENPDDFSFIPAFVDDNAALMAAQPDYRKQLEALPEKLMRAWLLGDWSVYEGQFFEEFCDNPGPDRINAKSQRWTHVVDPFPIPDHWPRFRSFDWGYAKPFSCGWWVVSDSNILYRVAEMYGCTKTPNEGVKWPPSQVFTEMKRIEEEHPILKGKRVYGVADPAMWDGSRDENGVTLAQMAAKQGIYFEPGNHARLPGWAQVHYRLAFNSQGEAKMYFFPGCTAAIRTLPSLIYDEVRTEDLDTEGEDHAADEIRYLCMRNPINPPREAPVKRRTPGPLDIVDDFNDHTPLEFYRL